MFSKEYLEDVPGESNTNEDIQEILRNSYLDYNYETKWQPVKIQIIRNKSLEMQFEEKKQDFIIRGCKADEMEEKFGFMVENNVAALEILCQFGLNVKDSDYNALGYNCMGVYLCRHADVCLQHALVKYSGSDVARLVIFRYMAGRQTTAIPRVASAAEFIEPTQSFDSHVSVIQPSCSDSLQNQYDRSQIYLYEINKILQPAAHPRQICPYAIVTFTSGGVYHPSVDAEPSAAEKLANNHQLQQIIKQINAKGDAGIPDVQKFDASQMGAVALATAPGATKVIPTVSNLQYSESSSKFTDADVLAGGTQVKPDQASSSENANLQKVISQINARLEMADRSRFQSAEGDFAAAVKCSMAVSSAYSANQQAAAIAAGARFTNPNVAAALGVMPGGNMLNARAGMGSPAALSQYNPAVSTGLHTLGLVRGGALSRSGFLGNMIAVSQSSDYNAALAAGGYFSISNDGASQFGADLMAASSLSNSFASTYPGLQTISVPFMRSMTGMVDPSGLVTPGIDPNSALYQQRDMIPVDYLPGMLSNAKDKTLPAGAYYPVQAVNAAGYALINQGVKRSLPEMLPYVEKRQRFM